MNRFVFYVLANVSTVGDKKFCGTLKASCSVVARKRIVQWLTKEGFTDYEIKLFGATSADFTIKEIK